MIIQKNSMAQQVLGKKIKGYVLLPTVLIVSAVGFAISISVVLMGIGFSNSSFSLEKSAMAKYYSDACAEIALQAIWDTDFVGSGSGTFSQGACSYDIINEGGDNRTIEATGISDSVTRKTKISINQISPTIEIASWESVADF